MIDPTDVECKYTKCIKIININLVPFRKEKELDLNNELIRWLIFLDKKSPIELVDMITSKDENIKTAQERVEELLQDEQFLHDRHMQQQADWKYEGEMTAAKEKDIKEGKFEEKTEIAIRLKKLDFSHEQIAEATGLKIEEIEKL